MKRDEPPDRLQPTGKASRGNQQARRVGKRLRGSAAGPIDPHQVRENDQHRDHAAEPRLEIGQARATLRGREREQREQAQQDQSGIGGQQQQAEIEPEHEPVASPVLADRPPVMQQGKRGERPRQHRRAELGSGQRKREDAGHQQHRHHRVMRADNRAAQHEHHAEACHDADLRQQIDAEQAVPEQIECDLREPIGERGSEPRAGDPFVAGGEHQRHVAGRSRIGQRRDQGPQQGLRERRHPEQQLRARAQQFHQQRHIEHRPGRDRAGRKGVARERSHTRDLLLTRVPGAALVVQCRRVPLIATGKSYVCAGPEANSTSPRRGEVARAAGG